ncbi:RHS repeat-associated core domain-containing protein, partial [Providencia stuartii]|nr:RHS repeat-associated core domain-containing protein [Providencia stuartii]
HDKIIGTFIEREYYLLWWSLYWIHDPHLRLVKATNPDSVVEFEYNAHGQLTCERINGREVHHQWDEATHTLTQTRFGERELHYAFGQLGELTSLQVGQHAPLRFSYNAVGQEYLRRSDAGFVNSSHYNAAGLLAHQRAGRGSENFLRAMQEAPHLPPVCTDVHRSFHYDRAHNVVGIEDTRWQRTQYRYNANDQITETQYSNQHRSQYERFQYDANLNLIEHTVVPEGAQVALHQLSQQQQAGRVIRRGLPRGYQDYHYDVNGRLAKKVVHQHGYRPQEWRYLWNTQNQLITCFTPSGDVWRYTYDAFGRRLSKTKTVDSEKLNAHPAFPVLKPRVTAWHYLWSGDQMVEEAPVYADGTVAYDAGIQWLYQPGAITPTARYQKGQLHYVVTDHQGTPREIFTEKGIASWAGRLNTWGQMAFWQSQDGRADNDPNYTECHFRFAGQYEDRETGLYYNRFRYYDKDSGQYISPDPIGLLGGLNPYGYVHCPTGFIDPLGLAGYCCNELLKEDRFRRHHSSSAIYLKHTKAKTQEEAMMFSSGGKPAQYWDIDAPNGKVTGSSMTSFRNKTEKEALRYGVYSPQKGGSDYYIYDAGRTIGFNNGQPTQYMRVEVTKSTNEFHGHPISNQTYNDYMRKVE